MLSNNNKKTDDKNDVNNEKITKTNEKVDDEDFDEDEIEKFLNEWWVKY